jgi:membrane protein DedA with SNARE-associated domain
MPQRRFLPAVTLGAALWSLIYTTVGFTVVDAWLGVASWWWALLAVAAVVGIFVLSGRLEASVKAQDPVAPVGPGAGGPAAPA